MIDELLEYWFGPEHASGQRAEPDAAAMTKRFDRWFVGGADVDAEIADRFSAAAGRAAANELDDWAASPRGRLALILLLDQVPRHLHRGTAAAFEQDGKASALVKSGVDAGMDRELPVLQRGFFYMPLQHAESLDAQQLSVRLYDALAAAPSQSEFMQRMLQSFADSARTHRDIIERFGRFPHRNRQLGRADTTEEQTYMREGGPSFGQ